MRQIHLALGLTLIASSVAAQQSPSSTSEHVIVALPNKLTWAPAPTSLRDGAELSVVEGDPSKAGPFTMRLRMPDGYRIPPHFHPVVEHVTVLEGAFRVGMGERFDAAKMSVLPAGTFAAIAPGIRHFAQAAGTTVIQLHGEGPWSLTYVNPADDPRAGSR